MVLKSPRRWLKFSLTTLLAAITLFGVLLGLQASRVQRRTQVVRAIEAAGGHITYRHQLLKPSKLGAQPQPMYPKSRVRDWLCNLVGEDWFNQVWSIEIGDTEETDTLLAAVGYLKEVEHMDLSFSETSDIGLRHLAELTHLESLSVRDAYVTDAGLAHLAKTDGLKSLDISYTDVTDAGLNQLVKIAGLESLDISCTNVTDAGLEHLATKGKLLYVKLADTGVTELGIEKLQQSLPKCRISAR